MGIDWICMARNAVGCQVLDSVLCLFFKPHTLVIVFEMNLSELRFRVAANKLMRNTPKNSCDFVVRNIDLK